MSEAKKCANSLSQGLNVDLPKAGLEPRTSQSEAERLQLDDDATPTPHQKWTPWVFILSRLHCIWVFYLKRTPWVFILSGLLCIWVLTFSGAQYKIPERTRASDSSPSPSDSSSLPVIHVEDTTEQTTQKEKPQKAPRRGSEPARPPETTAGLTDSSHQGGPPPPVPVPPTSNSRPPLTRSRAFSLQSESPSTGGVAIIGPLSLPVSEYSKLHPERYEAPRRLTQPSIADSVKVDHSLMSALAATVIARNRDRSASSSSAATPTSTTNTGNRSSYSEQQQTTMTTAVESPSPRTRSWNSPRSSRHDDVTHISERSTAGEVTEWLKNKKFSDRAVQVFRGHTGLDMFHLRLSDFQKVLTHDEATRLDGLLTLQKNTSGYGTRSAKELNEILQRRKQHVTETENQSDELNSSVFQPPPPELQQQQQQQQQEQQQQLQQDQRERQQIYARPAKGPDYRGEHSGASFQQQLIRQRSQLRQSQGELDLAEFQDV
ncbi:epidermal growth factor receptor kinase substrate 8 protein 2 [Elysia marginata]|uniref:Epidermal growth factor receptor kinase substrate 8 protein 2 n=1 Tax=Elysia marginata TaxID=1093978 RepID=A0AAV4FSB8_9GAST|nr:epidermal growth factor receptor kinase substrate 8 protein 2 [Elysia marginata]